MWIHGVYFVLPLLLNITGLFTHGFPDIGEDFQHMPSSPSHQNEQYPVYNDTTNIMYQNTASYPYYYQYHSPNLYPSTENFSEHYSDFAYENRDDDQPFDYFPIEMEGQLGAVNMMFPQSDWGMSIGDIEPYTVDMELISSNWTDIYSDYCGRHCVNDELILSSFLTSNRCPKPECYPCDCHQSCVSRGTCCPSSDNFTKNGIESKYDIFHRAKCEWLTEKDFIMTVSTCPRDWDDDWTRDQCEQPSRSSLESVTFYKDIASGLVFRNIYCVLCNGYGSYLNASVNGTQQRGKTPQRFKPMRFKVECKNYNLYLDITDPFVFLQAVASDVRCDIGLKDTTNALTCPHSFGDSYYETCPNDAPRALRDLCHELPPIPSLRVYGGKNIFCHLCHKDVEHVLGQPCGGGQGFIGLIPPMTRLFSSSSRRQDATPSILEICDDVNSDVDEKGACLPLVCTRGKTLVKGKGCQTAVEYIKGLLYRFTMKLTPTEPIPSRIKGDLINEVSSLLAQRISTQNPEYSITFFACAHDVQSKRIELEILFDGYILAPVSMSRDQFEDKILRDILSNPFQVLVVDHYDNAKYSISLNVFCFGSVMCFPYIIEQLSSSACSDVSELLISNNINYIYAYYSSLNEIYMPEISALLTCPFVTLKAIGPPIAENKKLKFHMHLNGKDVEIMFDPNSLHYENGNIYMCVDLYKNITNVLDKQTSPIYNTIYIINYYLDIACNFVSCTLLLVSMVTYLLFPCLRSLPGLNTLCMCLCLFTAQLSLVITSLFGAYGFFPPVYCIVHAIFLHYTWISFFVWMNTCCVHTYRVFTGIRIKYSMRNFFWYCLYSFGAPILVIGMVISITWLATDGNSFGYDEHICFLDTSTSGLILILGLLVPLFFSVLTNLILFVLTMSTILSMTRMRVKPKSNHGLLPYVKLSTITGVFCLFTATAIQFDNPVLSLIASPFAALQGVFIFLSFIANEKVYKLYLGLVSNKEHIIIPGNKKDIDVTYES